MTIKAIYEKGVFRPTEPVDLPEKAEVEVLLPAEVESAADRQAREEILEILSHRYDSGQTDTAERHNEHQT
jgi:predicted DNA-binding antitoxin AbrB/MazE fold protein